MRAAIERFAALIGRRLIWDAQGENDFSIQGALSHGVVAVIAQENRFVETQRRTVCPFEYALTPGAQKTPIPVEDNDRMRTTGKTIDLIFFIHRHRGHFFEGPAVRQFSPALDDFVAKFSAAYRYAHKNLLISHRFRFSGRAKPKPETRKLADILVRLMLIHLPPSFEPAAHTCNILEAVFNEVSSGPETAVTVITVHDHWCLFVGILDEFLNVAVMKMSRAGYMGGSIGTRIANIDEDALF